MISVKFLKILKYISNSAQSRRAEKMLIVFFPSLIDFKFKFDGAMYRNSKLMQQFCFDCEGRIMQSSTNLMNLYLYIPTSHEIHHQIAMY